MKINRFSVYVWAVLAYTTMVILWGAFVRATGSGAGCGSHWPSCQGGVFPRSPQIETLIEFTHRVSSGLIIVLFVGMLVWAFRAYEAGHPARRGATLSVIFLVIESLLGASLVLFGWVEDDASTARAVVMAIHLVNTFILLSVVTLTGWWASGGGALRWSDQGWRGWAFGFGYLGILLLGASGGITALGDTLFPAGTFIEGLRQDISPTTQVLLRLRVFHPLIALLVGGYVILIANLLNHMIGRTRRIYRLFAALFVIQVAIGAINVALLAPVWMQLVHLFFSDLMVIALTMLIASVFNQETAPETELRLAAQV